MAFSVSISRVLVLVMLLMLPCTLSTYTYFDISHFTPNMNQIFFKGDAFCSNGVLQLTKNQEDLSLTNSAGRTLLNQPIRLWNAKTGNVSSFTTEFTFMIKAVDIAEHGDGFSFFLAPVESEIPPNSYGGNLALFNTATARTPIKENQIVAVEFDSFSNEWDPAFEHIGINVNSIVSKTYAPWRSFIKSGFVANAQITYDSVYRKLSVNVTYPGNPSFTGTSLSYFIDLSYYLPEFVRIGFSAGTGQLVEIHNILSWKFFQTWAN